MTDIMRTETEPETTAPVACTSETIDATEAALEYASRAKEALERRGKRRVRGLFDVQPCARVRGYTLKLPATGWRLWFPNSHSALKFADRVSGQV